MQVRTYDVEQLVLNVCPVRNDSTHTVSPYEDKSLIATKAHV